MHKVPRILELVWLGMTIIGFGSFIYAMLAPRRDQAIYFIVFTFIAGIMYMVRKGQRKRVEADMQNKPKK